MIKAIKKMIGDWKCWVVLVTSLLNIGFNIYLKDLTEVMWVFLALILFILGNIQNYAVEIADEIINEQDDLLSKADYIIKAQTEVIKDLEEKLNGKD